jgi:uncharacterized membrane protein
MYACGPFWNGFYGWWIIPVAMMVLCFIMMRGHWGCMMEWHRSPQRKEKNENRAKEQKNTQEKV